MQKHVGLTMLSRIVAAVTIIYTVGHKNVAVFDCRLTVSYPTSFYNFSNFRFNRE